MLVARKETRPNKLELDRRLLIRRRGEASAEHNSRILHELQRFSFYKRNDLVRQIGLHSRLPDSFNPVYGEGRKFHRVLKVADFLDNKSYIEWISALFDRNRVLLKEFCGVRTAVSGDILNFRPTAALAKLDALNAQCMSWWAIEKSIHIQKELKSVDAKAVIKGLADANPHLNLSSITQDLLLMSESASIQIFISSVLSRVREYKISGIQSVVDNGHGESLRNLPLAYDADRILTLASVKPCWSFSLIDQYCLFRSIIIEQSMKGEVESFEILERAAELAESIGDFELLSMIAPPSNLEPFVKRIVDEYTEGQYEQVVGRIRTRLVENPVNCFALLELYARCKIYTERVGEGDTFYDRIADEYSKILQLDSQSADCEAYLEKIAVKFRDEGWAKSLLFHVFSLKKWVVDEQVIESARLATLVLGENNTPRGRDKDYQVDLSQSNEEDVVPAERRMRYDKALGKFPEINLIKISSDYLKVKAQFFLENELYREAINFCVEKCLDNRVAFRHLPVAPLCNKLQDLKFETRDDFVSALLLYDIYSKNSDGRYEDEKSELFEDFLDFCGKHKPSDIFCNETLNAMEISFLHHVCVPAQLDNIIAYSRNDEVVLERVAIIDLLIAAKVSGSGALGIEKDRVVENLFAEKLRAKIESGKLFVDVQALAAHRRQLYSTLYEQARALKGGLHLDPLSRDRRENESSDVLRLDGRDRSVVAASEKSSLLGKIYYQAAQDFALNENYGLEKYLSAEVRHVVFQTQLRSCFEKSKLLTVVKDGRYLSNEYWIQRYSTYVAQSVMQRLDEILADFSRKIDSILFSVNEQFRVHFLTSETSGIFDFSPYHRRVVKLAQIINESESYEIFFRNLIAFMWTLAGDGARAAQRLINGRLMMEVGGAIDELEIKLTAARGPVAMFELMEAIKTARSNFTKEVEIVLNWFRFVGVENVDAEERLSVVVEAAVSSFDSMFRHKGKKLIFSQEVSSLPLNYSEARALFISLFTALENALKYGEGDQPVTIAHKTNVPIEAIVITNTISSNFGDPNLFISNEKKKWNDENSKLSIVEGGTGLYKIHNILTKASPGFSFDIDIHKNRFSASISLHHEHFDHRRQSSQA